MSAGQPLWERSPELEEVEAALAAARKGVGRLLVLEGPAGIGKTSLLAAARAHAAGAGLRVLAGRGSELEVDFAFGIVRQLFEPVLSQGTDANREFWLSGAAGLARPLFDEELLTGAPPPSDARFLRRHGLYWLLANLARETPVLVALDDAQWADEPSIGFVRHLVTRLEHLPVAVFLASRPGARALAHLRVDAAARIVRPAPLSAVGVSRCVNDIVGGSADGAFVSACHRATGGNPFLLGELLREVRGQGVPPTSAGAQRVDRISPRGVSDSVLTRLAGLAPEAARLARAAAVLGEANAMLAGRLAGLDERGAAVAASALARADVLEPARDVRFVHPLVRTAVYEDIPPAERPRAHALAAGSLHAAGAGADRVAAQLVLSAVVGEPWALASLLAAARAATWRGAPEVAAHFLERALAEPAGDRERFEVMLALGRAQVLAGSPDAISRLRDAIGLARGSAQHARAAVKLARVLRYAGEGGEAVELLEAAAARLGADDERLAAVIEHELLATATVSYQARRRLEPRATHRRRDAATPPEEDFFDRLKCAAEAVEAGARGEPVTQVAGLAATALAVDPGHDHLGRHLRMLGIYAYILADELDAADAQLQTLADATQERGGPELVSVVAAQRALVALRRGHVTAAESHATDALELASALGGAPPAFLHTGAGALVWVAAEQGTEPHPLTTDLRADSDSLFSRHLLHARAALLVAQGQLAAGVEALLALGERESAIGWVGPSQFPWRSEAALALDALGDGTRARALVGEELELARAMGAPRALGIALRASARLAPRDERVGRLQQSVGTLETSGADLEHARSLVELGIALRHTRAPVHAREVLRRGYELADRCGAPGLLDRARQELVLAGSRPRRPALRGRNALTPSELRVVELAARETTNRDIAQTLFVTEKTVETHLGHAYAKLDVKSRRQLAQALADSA